MNRRKRDLDRGHQNDRLGLRGDQTILLTGVQTAQRYPDPLRRIHYFDAEKDSRLTFLTNNFLLSALTIAQLYRARWKVGVSRHGHINQSVKVRPRPEDSILLSKYVVGGHHRLAFAPRRLPATRLAQRTRLQRTVNADVASLHKIYNARKQQELTETSPMRQLSPAGYQGRHGVKAAVSTGEALGHASLLANLDSSDTRRSI